MNARFLDFIPLVLSLETEHHRDGSVRVERDGNDPGGTTKYGIDQRAHPRVDIAALTEEGARAIYFAEWQKAPCDELPRPFGELVFDVFVNGGHPILWLQTALREAGDGGVVSDGWCGVQTLAAAQSAAEYAPTAEAVIHRFCEQRAARFRTLAEQPRFRRYITGWLRRNETLRAWALAHLSA